MTSPDPFTCTINDAAVRSFTLSNADGMRCRITNHGARVLEMWTPDRHGEWADVLLGHDSIEGYLQHPDTFFGATVGRVANRTDGASFTMEGKQYRLSANDGANHLHGGPGGFHNKVWELKSATAQQLVLSLESPHGEEGYPGTLQVQASFTLGDDNTLRIDYTAQADQDTPLNLTNHSYFNLKGNGKGSIGDHILQIHASQYHPIRADFIPEGSLADVADSPFDFRKPTPLSEGLTAKHAQMENGRGFDHNFVTEGAGLRPFAKMWEPLSGRSLEVISDAPGMQFYSGNFLDGTVIGKGGVPCDFRSGFCFETQCFPNSLNQPNFPSIILPAGQVHQSCCLYRFGLEK
jgi:aldose 1-epimerase